MWDVWDTYLDFKNSKAYILDKGTLLGTPNREPQECSSNIIEIYPPGSLYSLLVLLYSWGSLSGVPIRTLLLNPMPSLGQTFTGFFLGARERFAFALRQDDGMSWIHKASVCQDAVQTMFTGYF